MSTNSPFAAPASAGGITWADLQGRLLVIEPLAVEDDIQTVHGPSRAVRANVHIIDGTPESYDDTLIFPKVLQGQTASKVGQKVLGRLGTGQAKPGQSAPWVIQEASPADVQAGVAWLQARDQGAFAAPAAGTPPF